MDSFLPKRDREYLKAKGLQYTEILDGTRKGLILNAYPLVKGKFNVDTADILVLIPDGYNDSHPDMFFTIPVITYSGTSNSPAATNGRIDFNKQQWQQWSRHLNVGNDWRAGIDGIESYLQKIIFALKSA